MNLLSNHSIDFSEGNRAYEGLIHAIFGPAARGSMR